MTPNRNAIHLLLGTSGEPLTSTRQQTATPWIRLKARLLAARLDADIERGAPAHPGSVLAAHTARITSFDERDHLARSLRLGLDMARIPRSALLFRVPLHREAALVNADLIDAVTLRLHAPLPVRGRGMARLRLLLADGSGPLYQPGRGSLTAQLRGVLAAL